MELMEAFMRTRNCEFDLLLWFLLFLYEDKPLPPPPPLREDVRGRLWLLMVCLGWWWWWWWWLPCRLRGPEEERDDTDDEGSARAASAWSSVVVVSIMVLWEWTKWREEKFAKQQEMMEWEMMWSSFFWISPGTENDLCAFRVQKRMRTNEKMRGRGSKKPLTTKQRSRGGTPNKSRRWSNNTSDIPAVQYGTMLHAHVCRRLSVSTCGLFSPLTISKIKKVPASVILSNVLCTAIALGLVLKIATKTCN